MTTSRTDEKKVEALVRELMERAREEGRPAAVLEQMRHALKFSPEVVSTIAEMHEEGRIDLVDKVYQQLKDNFDRHDITVSVDVTTAVPMTEGLRAKVREKCEKDFNAPVYLVEHVDPAILGGIILEARGSRRDASVRAQLVNVRKTLSSAFLGSDEQ